MSIGETSDQTYDRGKQDGEVLSRLANHDKHFALINGQIKHLAEVVELASKAQLEQMNRQNVQLQRLADRADADASTRISTAQAVEKSRQEAAAAVESDRIIRKERSDTAWSGPARLFAIIGAMAGIAVVISIIVALVSRKG